ncbi:hypothetical protein FRB98_001675 [Tulasnella sp. 332]|nr:hypothetical protein FRB98_001675 [Tulasnella sp. 332]
MDATDVSFAMKFARAQALPLAIRGGGHNASGAACSEGFVIDLRNMKSIRVNKEGQTSYVQGGTTTGQAQAEFLKYVP